jgi:hypothetical protein
MTWQRKITGEINSLSEFRNCFWVFDVYLGSEKSALGSEKKGLGSGKLPPENNHLEFRRKLTFRVHSKQQSLLKKDIINLWKGCY